MFKQGLTQCLKTIVDGEKNIIYWIDFFLEINKYN